MVNITKIGEAPSAEALSGDWSTYTQGGVNSGVSLPIDYTIKGELAYPIEEGLAICAARFERNGEKISGVFTTTPVVSMEYRNGVIMVKTANSVYLIESI